jgi:hypothetical protein
MTFVTASDVFAGVVHMSRASLRAGKCRSLAPTFVSSAPLRLAVAVILLLGVGGMAGTGAAHAASAPESAATPIPVAEKSAEEVALAAAKESGAPVEVATKTTETQQVFANPSGTFTVEQSSGPVRVRRGASWTPIDTNLRRRPDGSITAAATALDLTFSGGGTDAPMARIARGHASLALAWPSPLPAPVLSGDTATYADVLPGVDLQVRAHADSFSEVLVVKTAEAASQPALSRLQLGAQVSRASLRATASGGFEAVDVSGATVFSSPQPVMWDSKGDLGGVDALSTQEDAAVGTVDSRARARAPQNGDQTAPMDLEVGTDSVTVVPDPTLLRNGHFPLYLDPAVHGAKLNARAMVNQSYPTTEYYNLANAAHEGVGYTDQEGVHRKRLFWRYDTRPIHGKTILKATFSAYEVWSDSCTPTPVILGLTGWFDAGTNWNNQPAWVRQLGQPRTVAYGRPGCAPGGAWVEFDAKSAAVDAAAKRWAATSLTLRAGNEGHRSGWKRFRSDGAFAARLSIEYNSPPAVPTSLRTSSPVTSCVTGAGRPVIPADAPILIARLNDADTAQSVLAHFELWATGGARIGQPYKTAPKKPNVDYSVQLPDLAAGNYSWKVSAYDGYAWSAFSRWCEFTVDPSKPSTPTVTTPEGQNYAVGNKVSFTFGNGGSADVARYKWSFNDVPTSADVLAASPTALVPLSHFGPSTLRVWSYDKAGNRSEYPATLKLTILGGTVVGHWPLDEGSGKAAADIAAPAHPLTLAGGTLWTDGRWFDADPTDHGVGFDGTSAVANTAAADVIQTDQNFSVSTWVRVRVTTAKRVALSQGGTATRGFTLGSAPAGTDEDGNKLVAFEFALQNPDAAAPVEKKELVARSEGMVVLPDEWVHLTGVYEAGNKVLSLYVNGDAVDSVDVGFSPVNETGAVRLGRAQTGAAAPAFWLGDLDDVRAFAGALDETQVNFLVADARPKP